MANLCGRPTDSLTGNHGTFGNLYQLGYEWPWDSWIKPQIDAMHGLGANVIRLIFDATLRIGDSGHHGNPPWLGTITDQAMVERLDQIITYLASKGMYFYPTAAEAWALGVASVPGAAIQNHLVRFTEIVSSSTYENVVGIDLANEFDASTGTQLTTYAANMISAAKSARDRQIPVTFSTFCLTATGGPWAMDPKARDTCRKLIDAGVDYLDVHLYEHKFTRTDLANLFALKMPMVIGEIGINYNGRFDPSLADANSARLRADYYDSIVALSRNAEIQATGVWAAVQMSDYDGNDWGLYGKRQDANYAFIDPRTEMTSRFQLIPTTYERSRAGLSAPGGATTGR